MQHTGDIRCRFLRLEPFLDERGRRLFAANEAVSFGRGGVSAVSSATGIARSTINRGIAELQASHEKETRIRRPGAGRRRAEASQPGLLEAIETLVDDAIRGDPEATLRWVSRSQRHIVKALILLSHKAAIFMAAKLCEQIHEAIQTPGRMDMDRLALEESESRFAAFVERLNEVIGHRDRTGPFRDYCTGLLAGSERKSVEPLAAITAPQRVSAQHQSLLHFVGKACWSDAAVLGKVRELTLPVLEKRGPVEAWIIDDTGYPKKGKHSVGVARQYCGQLGKQDNCQIAVSLSVANRHASLPIAYRLYLLALATNRK